MGLRRPTEWKRTTVLKAAAFLVSDAEAEGSFSTGDYRRVRIVMRQGVICFRILDTDMDANDEIGAGRTFEWPEVEGPTDTEKVCLQPHQRLWAIVSNVVKSPGRVKLSIVTEYFDAAGPHGGG